MLASVYKYYNISDKDASLSSQSENLIEFKNTFLTNLTIDKFLMAQNGILPQVFEPKNNIAISQSYESFILPSIKNKKLKKKLVTSYENFRNFFQDPNVKIDYTYLWDLICRPISEGGVLFENGINMLIFKSPNNDMTSKIELICPTHHNSHDFFSIKKPTLMIYSKNNFYEPLCKITRKNNRKTVNSFFVKKFFNENAFSSLKKTSIYRVIKKIKKVLKENCGPKNSVQNYNYFPNISSVSIIKILKSFNYNIQTQVVNDNLQVVGLIVNDKEEIFYLPCKASNIIPQINFSFVSDQLNYNTYNKTLKFLKHVYEISDNRIQSNPIKKIVDNEHIVGIITSSNQFVPVIPEAYEERPEEGDIKVERTYNIGNELLLDNSLIRSKKQDNERKLIVKKLTLENSFYNIFRNTFKIILNYRKYLQQKQELKSIINNPIFTYVEKMNKIIKIVMSLMENVVKFQKIKIKSLSDYDEMIACISLDNTTCSKMKHCLLREENGICKVILPKNNLYSKEKNKKYYYVKISDELIRFPQIRKYLFTPKSFLSFQHVKYKIHNNEIVILEEILERYFDDITLKQINEYTKDENIYELTQPISSIKYSSNIDFKENTSKKSKSKKSKSKKSKSKKLGKTLLQ